jgi:hypothetical protein
MRRGVGRGVVPDDGVGDAVVNFLAYGVKRKTCFYGNKWKGYSAFELNKITCSV